MYLNGVDISRILNNRRDLVLTYYGESLIPEGMNNKSWTEGGSWESLMDYGEGRKMPSQRTSRLTRPDNGSQGSRKGGPHADT